MAGTIERDGKYVFGMVKVGDKGQIVIPSDARKIFNIHPGDSLMVLGDTQRGLAILPPEAAMNFAMQILSAQEEEKE